MITILCALIGFFLAIFFWVTMFRVYKTCGMIQEEIYRLRDERRQKSAPSLGRTEGLRETVQRISGGGDEWERSREDFTLPPGK